MESISFNDFSKMDLRTAKIIEVEDIEGKDKLYKLTVDLGSEKRTLVAGLKEFYSKEDLMEKQIVVLVNLEPKKLAGIESQGMLLAAETEEKIALVILDKEIPLGSKVH